MKDPFDPRQSVTTLRHLEAEHRRLQEQVQRFQEEASKIKEILNFHDRLEKDFFSADSLEDLIIKLINCIHLKQDIDFVSLCLSRQYLESLLGTLHSAQGSLGTALPTTIGYLSVVDEWEMEEHLEDPTRVLFEKTPRGSPPIFFPGHGDEVRSHAIIPLRLRGRTVGTLNIGSIRSSHYYTTATGAEFLGRLSAKLAIGIDNILSHQKLAFEKRILDEDISRASLLQKSLLPSAPLEVGPVRISAYFKPCQDLGGDFYDYFLLPQEKLGLVLADVTGHGISSALIAAMLKSSLQMDRLEVLSPGEIVSRLNQKFCEVLKQGDLITLCYATIGMEDLVMELARAGHPYPLLYRASSKDTLHLSTSGSPLGWDPSARYEPLRVQLYAGDMVFFYTDGLTDALFGQDQPHGFRDRVMLAAGQWEGGDFAERFLREVAEMGENKELEDDTSLLVVSVKSPHAAPE